MNIEIRLCSCKSFRIWFLTLLTLIPVIDITAQPEVDSLISVRSFAEHDSTKVLIDIALGKKFGISHFDSAIFYYDRALALSRNERLSYNKNFEAKALESIAFLYSYSAGKTQIGIDHFLLTIPIYKELNNIEKLAKNYFNIAFFYGQHLNNYDSSALYYEKSIEVESTNSTNYKIDASHNNAGLMYYYMGEYEKGIKYGIKASKLRSPENIYGIACSNLNIGMSFQKLTKFEDAKKYYNKAINGFKRVGHKANIAVSYKNVADVLMSQDSLDQALLKYHQASILFKKEEGLELLSDCFLNMGEIYLKLKEYEKAEDFLLESEKNAEHLASSKFKGQIYAIMARVKRALADSIFMNEKSKRQEYLISSIEYGELSWKVSQEVNSPEVHIIAAKALVEAYSSIKNYRKAFNYSQKLNELTSMLTSKNQSEALAKMATEFNSERLNHENALLKKSRYARVVELQKQKIVIGSIMMISILLLVVVFIMFRSRKKLQEAKSTVDASLSEKEILLKEIHHRVKNNLQVVSSLLDLQSRDIEGEKALSTFMEGQNRVKAMALIHQKLYQNENLSTINFVEYAEQLMKELATIYPSANGVKTNIDAGRDAQFDIDTAIPLGLILNELISNAYKYAFEGNDSGELSISVESLGEGKHQLTVEDNGRGLPKEFNFVKAKSLGLRLVRRLAKQLYGKVEYSEVHGARFVVSFTDTLERRAV